MSLVSIYKQLAIICQHNMILNYNGGIIYHIADLFPEVQIFPNGEF